MPRLLHHISARYLIDSPFEAPWGKNGKYEYCYLFSNSQNSPKCRFHSLHAPLN